MDEDFNYLLLEGQQQQNKQVIFMIFMNFLGIAKKRSIEGIFLKL